MCSVTIKIMQDVILEKQFVIGVEKSKNILLHMTTKKIPYEEVLVELNKTCGPQLATSIDTIVKARYIDQKYNI